MWNLLFHFSLLLFPCAALAASNPPSSFTVGRYKVGIARHHDNINILLIRGKRQIQLAGGVWFSLWF